VAVRRVVAAIDVVINGQRNIDRLAQGYVAVERAAQSVQRTLGRVTTTTTTTSTAMQALNSSLRQVSSGFMGFVNAIDRGRNQIQQGGRATRGFTDNILSLTKSMLLFSVLLPIVQLPQRAIESFADFIKVGSAWQDQMRVSNTLLRLNEEQFQNLSRQVGGMAIQYNVATESMRALMTTASSSVAAIRVNETELARLGKTAYDASVAFQLAEASARLAFATGTDASEATTTLIQTMATYGLEIEHVAAVSDSLFAITDVGTVRFNELEHVLPRVTAAMGPLIARYDTAEEKMTVMNESFAAFAAMTQVMPAEQAATSFANIFKDIAQMTGKQKDLVTSWERIRKAQNLGRDMSLDPTALLEGGSFQAITQLRKIFDLRGQMVDAYVAQQRRMGNTAEEDPLRVTGQMQLMQAYFEDMRAVRGFQLATPELFERAQKAYNEGRVGSVAQGEAEMNKSFAQVSGRMGIAWQQIQTEMFKSLEPSLVGGGNAITAIFTQLLQNADFKSGDFLSKMRIFGGELMAAFSGWFLGGGRGQIQTVGRELGTFIGEAITNFFKGSPDNVMIEAARAFGTSFVQAIGETLPELLKSVISSSLTKALVEMVAIRYITKGWMSPALSRGAAVGGTMALEGASDAGGIAGMIGPAVGGLIMAGAGVAALRRGGRANIFGAGGIGGPAGPIRNFNDAMGTASLLANNRVLPTSDPASTRAFVNPNRMFPTGAGWPGFGAIAKAGGKVGGNALIAALMGAGEIIGADTDRERWGAIGGTIGSIGGAALGGLAGGGIASIATGLAGSMVVGGLGRAAGGGLYDLFHPATGQGAGVAEAEAPERLAMAEVFATGVDASQAVPLLTQIRDVLIRSGGGSIGGFSAPSAGGAATSAAPTRSLASSFVNQMDTTQLTPAQASAACGPAAAAFFARAYGRNPTLKEAYSLVTAIQGGDPASSGGTRGVATLGTALNQMGVSNEVYQGANVDWGRLAEGSKAGQPGIVNVGPRGKFPGHFFQIGGWDPTSNRFNVGSSGTNLKGGKEWMTPEEMMALGPLLGAVYGGGTGKGGVTEADIASIQGTPGTGMGPGAAGSTVINVQNLMNVDRIDGNTDIKALMGQMAEMLRSLSSGGSVVGQSGVVAP
jgi:hypothetical protein